MLQAQPWNGNIRELQNCVEKAVILSDGRQLTVNDFQLDARPAPVVSSADEEQRVREAMDRTGGNISAAAKMLGVSRPTLYAKLKKYGL